jgi:hemerythrin-like domain-containing protein
MNAIMTQLHQDHINLSRLLTVLKNKLVELKEGERPDYHLIQDVIHYIVDYADTYHHPMEDVLYQYTIKHYPEHQETLNEIEQEHATIRGESNAFQEQVENILLDAIVPMGQFIEQLDQFVTQQFAHLNREEGRIFPLLEKTLSDDDWASVKAHLDHRDDPLFGNEVAEEYKRLYQALIEETKVA